VVESFVERANASLNYREVGSLRPQQRRHIVKGVRFIVALMMMYMFQIDWLTNIKRIFEEHPEIS